MVAIKKKRVLVGKKPANLKKKKISLGSKPLKLQSQKPRTPVDADDSDSTPQDAMIVDNGDVMTTTSPATTEPKKKIYTLKYRLSHDYPTERHMFLKLHDDNEAGLTVSNVAPFIEESSLRKIFANFVDDSKILSIFIKRGNTGGFRVFLAVFASELWLQQFLAKVSSSSVLDLKHDLGIEIGVTGLKKYAIEYNSQFKPINEIRKNIELAVSAYDEHAAEEKQAAKAAAVDADEDGWVQVTSQHKLAFRARKGAIKKAKNAGGKKA